MAANPELKDEVVEVQYGMLFPEKALVVAALVVGGVFLLTSL